MKARRGARPPVVASRGHVESPLCEPLPGPCVIRTGQREARIGPMAGTTFSPELLARLEALLLDFDLNWRDGWPPPAPPALAADDPPRLPALGEMVKIDMERQRQLGRHTPLADYLRRYPELGTPATVEPALILAEYL